MVMNARDAEAALLERCVLVASPLGQQVPRKAQRKTRVRPMFFVWRRWSPALSLCCRAVAKGQRGLFCGVSTRAG